MPDLAGDGQQAAEAAKKNHYDLILMVESQPIRSIISPNPHLYQDIQMPVMSGIEATKVIRDNPDIIAQPVILALTANALTSDREKCLAAGMDGHISKPVKGIDIQKNIELFCTPGRRGLIMEKSASAGSNGSSEVISENVSSESGSQNGEGKGSLESITISARVSENGSQGSQKGELKEVDVEKGEKLLL